MVIVYTNIPKKSRKIYKKNSLAESQARKTYYNKSINKNGVIRQARKSMCPAVPPILMYITIIQYDNDNQGCEPLILLTSK